MQQHTGSHILSVAFHRLYGIPAISFHLGHEVSTIDLATPSLSQEQHQAAEQWCNEIIREDLPVKAHLDELREIPSASAGSGATVNKKMRLIEIEGLDVQPCGGTHVASTGQIGLLLLRKSAKLKANCRIEFVCGVRAAQFAQKDYAVIRDATRQLSCTFANLPEAIATVIAERDASVAFRDRMRGEMARLHADFLLGQYSKSAGSVRVITQVFDKQESTYLKLIALRLMETAGTIALLGSREEGCVVFAQSPGLPTDMRSILQSVLVPNGGKGGGMKDIAQGMAANQVSMDLLLAKANEKLTETLMQDKSVFQKSRERGLDNFGWAATGD
jgi:alanyl-tRNA synthetase